MIIKGRVIRVRRYRRTVEEVQETATRGGCAPGGLGVTGCYITAGMTPRQADLLTLWVESLVLVPRFGGTRFGGDDRERDVKSQGRVVAREIINSIIKPTYYGV